MRGRDRSSLCQTSTEHENGLWLVNGSEFVISGEWHEPDGDLRKPPLPGEGARFHRRGSAVAWPVRRGRSSL
jgi:hypothetical protein